MIPTAGKVLTPAQYGAVAPPGDKWPLNDFDENMYAINRIYPTIQGEGGQAGTPMTIVRLQGCPVQCVFCDTAESWALPSKQFRHSAEVAAVVRQYPPHWALVTGGEPCWHHLRELTTCIHELGMKTALETSGVYPITGSWDYVTISPKPAGKLPFLETNLFFADEVKWVIGRQADLDYVEKESARFSSIPVRPRVVSGAQRISLQPMSTSEKATKLCLDALMKHPEWKLSVQLHKVLGVA